MQNKLTSSQASKAVLGRKEGFENFELAGHSQTEPAFIMLLVEPGADMADGETPFRNFKRLLEWTECGT